MKRFEKNLYESYFSSIAFKSRTRKTVFRGREFRKFSFLATGTFRRGTYKICIYLQKYSLERRSFLNDHRVTSARVESARQSAVHTSRHESRRPLLSNIVFRHVCGSMAIFGQTSNGDEISSRPVHVVSHPRRYVNTSRDTKQS